MSAGALLPPTSDVAVGATRDRRGAPALGSFHVEARKKQGGQARKSQIFVDGIKAVGVYNHLLRIDCVAIGPNNEERSSGGLLISGDHAGPILASLKQALRELDKKLREQAQQQGSGGAG